MKTIRETVCEYVMISVGTYEYKLTDDFPQDPVWESGSELIRSRVEDLMYSGLYAIWLHTDELCSRSY